MALQAKTVADLSTSYADAQAGDLIPVERAGVMGKQTRAELASGVVAAITKTGTDADVVTGTAGTDGDVATWNADGDVVGGTRMGMEFIASQDASASAQLDFTGFDATRYDAYIFAIQNVVPASDGAGFWMRTSGNSGASYDSGAADYAYGYTGVVYSAASPFGVGQNATNRIELDGNAGVGNAPSEGISSNIFVFASVGRTRITFQTELVRSDGVGVAVSGAGSRRSEVAVNAVRFFFTTGNIASGTITMYGLRNS